MGLSNQGEITEIQCGSALTGIKRMSDQFLYSGLSLFFSFVADSDRPELGSDPHELGLGLQIT